MSSLLPACLHPSPFPHLTCLNPSSLVTHPHLKTCRIKIYRWALISVWSLQKWILICRVATRWRSLNPPIASQERQMRSVTLLSKQEILKATSRLMAWLLRTVATLLGRWITPRNDTAGTFANPGMVNFIQPLAPNGTADDAEEMEPRLLRSRFLQIWQPNQRPAQSTRAEDEGLLDGAKKDRNLLASLRFTFRTSLVLVLQRFGAGDVAAGRRAADVHRD